MGDKREFPKNIVPLLKPYPPEEAAKIEKRFEEMKRAYENGEEEEEQQKPQKLEVQEDALLGKDDIMRLFNCQSDKALKILRLAYSMKYASKTGREYYIKKEDFDKFFEHLKGRNVEL